MMEGFGSSRLRPLRVLIYNFVATNTSCLTCDVYFCTQPALHVYSCSYNKALFCWYGVNLKITIMPVYIRMSLYS